MCVTAKINKLMNIQLYKWQTESRKRSESIERHHQGWPKIAQRRFHLLSDDDLCASHLQLHNIITSPHYTCYTTSNEMESKNPFKI